MPEARLAVLILTGENGGHYYASLALSHAMEQRNYSVHWLINSKTLNENTAPSKTIFLHELAADRPNLDGFVDYLKYPFIALRDTIKSVVILREIRPDCVLGTGGYATSTGGIAAFLCRTPLIVHDQNSRPERSTLLLASIAQRVFTAYPGKFSKRSNVSTVGNPIRASLLNILPPEERYNTRTGPLRILILGGTQGDQTLNENFPSALSNLQDNTPPLCVWHQAGNGKVNSCKVHYASSGFECDNPTHQPPVDQGVVVTSFIKDMAIAYAWADLVICRASPLTVSEISQVGVAAVFILSDDSDDNQEDQNARFLVRSDAAQLYSQESLTQNAFIEPLTELLNSRKKLQIMATKAHATAKPGAIKSIVDRIDLIVNSREN